MKVIEYLHSKFMDNDYFFGAVHNIKPIKLKKEEYNKIKDFFAEQEKEVTLKIEEKKIEFKSFILPTPNTIFPENGVKVSDNGDYLGCTFICNNLYLKGIKNDAKERFRELYYSGILQTFVEYEYVPKFKISNYYSKDHLWFLEIEPIKKQSLETINFEDTVELSIFVSFLQTILNKQGFSLQDPNIENFCYSVNHPYYLDFGSFEHKLHRHKEYSLVISLIYQIILSYFPNSIFHDYYVFGIKTEWNSNKKNDIYKYNKIEVRKVAKKFVSYHRVHSSSIVYRAAKRIVKKFECRPEDLFILFSKADRLEKFNFLNFKQNSH